MENVVRYTVRSHLVSSEVFHPGARRFASQLVHPLYRVAEFNSGRRCDEMHRLARVAHDAHVDRHDEDYGMNQAQNGPSET